jgi:hypothetical protein
MVLLAHRSAPSTFGAPRPKSKREIRKEALAEAAASGLPEGWVEVTDDSGRVAFYGNVGNCVETKHRARFLAVDETQFWGQRRVDGVGRLKIDFHTGEDGRAAVRAARVAARFY